MNESRNKDQIVASIMRQGFYQSDSGLYLRTFERLTKLPMQTLRELDLILTMRVAEAVKTARDADDVLAKPTGG